VRAACLYLRDVHSMESTASREPLSSHATPTACTAQSFGVQA